MRSNFDIDNIINSSIKIASKSSIKIALGPVFDCLLYSSHCVCVCASDGLVLASFIVYIEKLTQHEEYSLNMKSLWCFCGNAAILSIYTTHNDTYSPLHISSVC